MNQVDRTADGPEHMALGTANGPTRFGPLVRVVSAAATMVRVDGPPAPTISPVMSPPISAWVRPLSAMACSMAIWA